MSDCKPLAGKIVCLFERQDHCARLFDSENVISGRRTFKRMYAKPSQRMRLPDHTGLRAIETAR